MAAGADVATFITTLNTIQAAGPVYDMIKNFGDAVHEETPILYFLNKECKTSHGGGDEVAWNLIYNTRNARRYAEGGSKTLERMEYTKSLREEIAYYELDVTYFRKDLKRNQGEGKLQSYVAMCIDNTKKDFARTLTFDVLGNGTTSADGRTISSPKPLVGLELYVETLPASAGSTVGGQTRTASTTWLNNQALSITALAALTTSDLQKMRQRCTHQNGSPTVSLMADDVYRKIYNLAKAEGWYEEDGSIPFENIKLGNLRFIADKHMTGTTEGGLISTTSLNRIWFLNPTTWEYRVDPTDDMVFEPIQISQLQHALTQNTYFRAQVVCLDPRSNGVIYWS